MNQQQVSQRKQRDERSTVQYPVRTRLPSHTKDNPILHAQGVIGNHGVLRRFGENIIQAKLRISSPNDSYEKEANRVSDILVRMPKPLVKLQLEKNEEKNIYGKSIADKITPFGKNQGYSSNTSGLKCNLESRIQSLKGNGRPLSISERAVFEPRLRHDLSNVRLHLGPEAAMSARILNARAYTINHNIVFGEKEYAPNTTEGFKLLAHELVHSRQQTLNLHPGIKGVLLRKQVEEGKEYTKVNGPTQSFLMDSLGWVGDLIKSLGWAILAGGEERGRASLHLLHNMIGSGEPIMVPKQWIMDSPTWHDGYLRLFESATRNVAANAVSRDLSGETSGVDHFSKTTELGSMPKGQCIFPWCEEADQFYGSGNARFTVEGDYSWYVPEDSIYIEIQVYNIVGRYKDYYVWEHAWDPGQHSRQERGWYTPFSLTAEWDEPDRQMRGLRSFGPPFSVWDVSEIEKLF